MYVRGRRVGRVSGVVVIQGCCLYVEARSITIKDGGPEVTGWGNRWCGSDNQGCSALSSKGLFVVKERRWCLLENIGMYCCVVRSKWHS